MNEILFIFHVIVVMAFGFAALRLGKATLAAWIALQAVLANLFVIKQIDFFGFHVTCSDVFAIGSMLGLNLLQEYFGKDAAKKALWASFFAMLFFVAMAQIHLFYQPSPFDTSHASFETILSSSPRLLMASISVFVIVQQIDLRLFGTLKQKFPRLPLSARNGLSLSVTQLLDTALFSFLGLWGLVAHLFDVIFISFLIKLAIIALMSPLTHFSKRFIPKKDYDSV